MKQAAAERLAEMVDPLLTELFRIARYGESDTVRLSAIRDALDRAGYKPTDRSEINMSGSGVQIYLPARTEQPRNGATSIDVADTR